MSTNIFISILRELHVPFTKGAALRAYEDHPYKYTFYGLKSRNYILYCTNGFV